MIKTVNTEAEYAALPRDTFESSAVFVRADNFAHIDGVNTITRNPKRGDIIVLDEQHKRRYIRLSTFVMDRLSATWTIVGVVADVEGDDILEIHKTNTSKPWANGYAWKLTGYTLDGTDRTGIISIREASNSWGSNVDYTVSYNASTLTDFVAQLNAFFTDTANPVFQTQDWVASINSSDEVVLTCIYTSWQQSSYNTGKTGFSMSGYLMPWYTASNKMLRVNGQRSGEGAISSMARALVYYRNDNGTSSYQGGRTSVQTDVKQTYPINLPTWLGTSTKNPGDFCSALRAIYGQGEAGWKRFMDSCRPVMPSRYGIFADYYNDGLAITKRMAAEMRPTQAGTLVPFSPMADYCQSIGYDCDGFRLGEWAAATTGELDRIISEVEYNATNNREADDLNKALYLIGGSAVSNGSSLWSCGRYGTNYGWYSNGYNGFFNLSYFFNSFVVVPVAHHKLSECEL